MSYEKFISNSVKKSSYGKKEFFIFNEVLLLLQKEINDLNIRNVCKRIQKNIPKKLFKNLDYIYIGSFEELDSREIESAYLKGAIYISNNNLSEESIYKSIIHELAHSVEETHRDDIYGDSELAAEFISKRKKLRSLLKSQGYELENPSLFLRLEYNLNFDNFLYKTVGYELLNQICVGLFSSPYAATSLREYFANGFENYFLYDIDYLKKISPRLYYKIYKLTTGSS